MVTSRPGTSSSLLSLPPNLLKKYNSLVLSSPSTITQIESTLRSLTYFLPGARLNDSELASESIYTLTNLLSLYHDSLLARQPSNDTTPKNIPHARYTKFWTSRSQLYKHLARLLKTVQYTELLWEMVGRRKGGERGRWRVVVFLEGVKAIIRMCLCWLTGGRWVLSSPLPEREDVKQEATQTQEEPNEWLEEETPEKDRITRWENGLATPPLSESEKVESSSALESPNHESSSPPPAQTSKPRASSTSSYTLPRTNITLPPLPSPSQISDYLSLKTLTASSVRPAPSLIHRLSTTQSQIAELLYILRPLVFAILMQRVATRHVTSTPSPPSASIGRPSWKREWMPWIVGLGMEWGSRQLMKRDIESRVPAGLRGLSELEREEVKKRGWAMGWWVMRGAFYETFTRKYIVALSSRLKSKPLIDLVAGIVDDYEYLWDNYSFATSSM